MSKLKKIIGVPFKNKGRDYGGMDCQGVMLMAHKAFGIFPDEFNISCADALNVDLVIRSCRGVSWMPVDVDTKLAINNPKLLPVPCLVVIKNYPRDNRICNHLATHIGFGKFIHTMRGIQASVEDLWHPIWKNKIEGFYTYVGA